MAATPHLSAGEQGGGGGITPRPGRSSSGRRNSRAPERKGDSLCPDPPLQPPRESCDCPNTECPPQPHGPCTSGCREAVVSSAGGEASATCGPVHRLHELPKDVLSWLLTALPLQSALLLGQTCKLLAAAMLDDVAVWRLLCLRDFGQLTDVELWMQQAAEAEPAGGCSMGLHRSRSSCSSWSDSGNALPTSADCYRSLYWIMHHNQQLVGTWRGLGFGSAGALFHFRWQPDCIEGTQVVSNGRTGRLQLEGFHTFGGRYSNAAATFIDGSLCTVEVLPEGGSPAASCSKAEAAALVARSSGVVLGQSPEGTFGHEFMLFMQGNVAPGRKKKKSPGRQLRDATSVVHHLSSLLVPCPTPMHPLSGLWKGRIGNGTEQVICVEYCFKKNSARITATKVTGDGWLGCGSLLWEAEASGIEQPWAAAESELLHIVAAEQHHGPPEADPPEAEVDEAAAAAAVSAVHMGWACAAQFGGGKGHVPGRLWRYDCGDFGFCWVMEEDRHFVRFTRLDDLLESEVDR